MNEKVRAEIVQTIKSWIQENGSMPLRLLKTTLKGAKIPFEAFEKVQPKSWISNQFPEFRIVGTNGHEQIVISDILQILEEVLQKEGKVALSGIAPLLNAHHIDWKILANGKKIYEWILESYPGMFKVSNDKYWLYPTEAIPVIPPTETEIITDQMTRSYIYRFCYCPVSNPLLQMLKELTKDETMTQVKWASLRTFALAQCLLGLNGGMLDDSQAQIPRMAFRTGLKTALEQDIYGVMILNTNKAATQKWLFSTVTFPGQETEEGYWLCDTFGIKSQLSYGDEKTKIIESVEKAFHTVMEAQKVLLEYRDSIQCLIEKGCILSEQTTNAIMEYISGWKALKKALEVLGEDLAEDNMESVQKLLDAWNDTNRVQEELEEKYEQLVKDVWNFMNENMLCRENLSDKDIASWKSILHQNFTEEVLVSLRKQMEPFRAIKVLRSFDIESGMLGDAEYSAMDAMNIHFGSKIKPTQLKYSICDKELDMNFLNFIPEIDALIKQMENKNQEQQQEYVFDDALLLQSAIDGTLWKIAEKAFGKPNELEIATMLGDMEAVCNITSELGYEESFVQKAKNIQFTPTITPLHAAERLEQLLGSSAKVIDQCLLFGVMQQEEGAVEHLIQHYMNTNRYPLAYRLFDMSADRIPMEARRHLILSLLEGDCISINETIKMDIPALLTEQGIDLVRRKLVEETDIREQLLILYENIKPTLIHHIVFLSAELQNYILSPENTSEIEQYGFKLSEKNLAELLRQNTFDRGTKPLQVAKRIDTFIGNWNHLAEQFALLAPVTLERQLFLFKLYCNKIDDMDMLQFLDENPQVKQEYFSYYLDLLFRNEKYKEICSATEERNTLSTKEHLLYLISMIKIGEDIEDIPKFDAMQAMEYRSLVLDISDALALCHSYQHKEFVKNIFPTALSTFEENELERLVTANGKITKGSLYQLAKEVIETCPALTIYCEKFLDSLEFEELREEYLKKQYHRFTILDSSEQKKIIREFQILNSKKYAELADELFQEQFIEILQKEEDVNLKAEKLTELLNNNVISTNVLQNVVEQLKSDVVISCAPLYNKLCSMIQEDECMVDVLKVLYQYQKQKDEAFRIFVCEQILVMEKQGKLSKEFLIDCEELLLEFFHSLPKEDIQNCILHIEEYRGRETYVLFVKYIMEHNLEPEIELRLLCDALEDNSVKIEEYLNYCATLVTAMEAEEKEEVEYEGTDAMAILLHVLYKEATNPESWSLFERMIPQKRIRARAYTLYYYASYLGKTKTEDVWKVEWSEDKWSVSKADAAWKRCVDYCMIEEQHDLFFCTLRSWLYDINDYYKQQLPWYSIKHYMLTLQRVLEDSDNILQGEHKQITEFPSCSKETAEDLIKMVIDVFKRVDQDKTNQVSGDDNHNSLRIIIELGLQLNCETLLLEKLSDELTKAYINLGLVVICRLLLAGKLENTKDFLKIIKNPSGRECNYASLVDKLAVMDTTEELDTWLKVESNRAILRFILPNGNKPDILRLQTLVMSSYTGDEIAKKNAISVIETLLDCYPEDVMCYKALFIICKENYRENLPRIYQALVGIFKFYPPRARKQFTRDRNQILRLIEILCQVMENLGEADWKIESTSDLIREYYHEEERTKRDEVVSTFNQFSEEIKKCFNGINKDSEHFSLLVSSLLGAVTEHWAPFFREAFQQRSKDIVRTYYIDKYSTRGLLRGALRVWQELSSDEERTEFLKWINREVEKEKESIFSKHAMKQFNNITSKINMDSVNWSMLRLPWEEHLVCLGNLKDIGKADKNCCYKIMMAERLKGQSARDSFVIMIRIAQDSLKAQLLYGNAAEWFRKGDYDLAGAAYDALAITNITSSKEYSREEYNEIYGIWMRISYVFAGKDMREERCSPHSCINMIVALMNAGYAKYLDRLRNYFTGVNLKLFQSVRKILSSTISEEEIGNMVTNFQQSWERPALIAFLHFILSKDRMGKYLFLTEEKKINELHRCLESNEENNNKYWILLQTKPLASVFPIIDEEQVGFQLNEVVNHRVIEADTNFVPRFVLEKMEELCENENIENIQETMEAYNKLTTYLDSDYSKRLRLSALICSYFFHDGDLNKKELAIVRFGINYYYYCRGCMNEDESSWKNAHHVMLDLATYGLNRPAINSEVIQFLPIPFQYCIRSYATIEELLKDYSENRHSYEAIRQLLSDTEYSDAANGLLEILNELLAVSDRIGSTTIDIRNYQTAQVRLSEIAPARDWVEMIAALNEMLRQAINKLDQRPSLKITLFNPEAGLQNDALYGEIENTGRDVATRLELQATFPRNDFQPISALYRLSYLRPNEKAAFAIMYKAPDKLSELEYILNLSYSHKESRFTKEALGGVLALTPNVKTPDTIPRFDTQIASAFTIENGEIVSKDFKGRKTQIQSLTALLDGTDFSQYRSAIVQGIKRSGKTSLLNYLRAFIRAKKKNNTIQIFVDCQKITQPYIYKTFFKSVLDELPLEYPKITEHPGWPEFVMKWKLPEDKKDREEEELSLFFRQLHTMLDGKGIYLIIDEFDVLLDRLKDEGRGFDFLLQSLRSLQMNPDCFDAIHMVLCGSNHLLVYNKTGSAFNQMFQSYELIPIGQMLSADIQEMIGDLLKQHPCIRFAKAENNGGISPSIQWIERYTGGLVWYTRLLVNEAIKNVLTDHRNCVYPSDICAAFNSICNYNNCRQLTDGCDENDKLVLDAIKVFTDRPQSYVSFEKVMQLLETQLSKNEKMSTEQLRKSLSVLTDSIELLEQKSVVNRSYCFRIELYRRYFRTREGKFDRKLEGQISGDCFTIVETESNIKTIDANSAFDDI